MFKFEGEYNGLDDFLLTDRADDLRGNIEIGKRLDKISTEMDLHLD